MTMFWMLAGLCAGIYCIARAIRDFRDGNYIWTVLGILSGAVFLLTPIQSHAVKIDLPTTQPPR